MGEPERSDFRIILLVENAESATQLVDSGAGTCVILTPAPARDTARVSAAVNALAGVFELHHDLFSGRRSAARDS